MRTSFGLMPNCSVNRTLTRCAGSRRLPQALCAMHSQVCPGCQANLPPIDGPTHGYMESSPACWAKFGKLLVREYSDYRYMAAHQLTVDAYAIQHPGQPSPQSIQSVCVHLVSLYASLERDISFARVPALRKRCAHSNAFLWLEPPASRGSLTVLHALSAQTPGEHMQRVREWAQICWDAWAAHHSRVVEWFAMYGGGT
ncbi:MAG: DUF5946 family protein [Bryobacteraceae bacterium]